jgi:hypothetical protein
LLRNFSHTSHIRKRPHFQLSKDFYNQPKLTIDRFHGKAQKWLKWRGDQLQFYNEYNNNTPLMINVFVRRALQGIVWKNEFPHQNYDFHLILPRNHELRNLIKENHAQLDRQYFFNPELRRENVYNIFKEIFTNKIHEKRRCEPIYIDEVQNKIILISIFFVLLE